MILLVNLDTGGGVVDSEKNYEGMETSPEESHVYHYKASINDNDLHFYKYTATGGKEVKYFIVKDIGGTFHVSLDLCHKLHPARSGWKKDGTSVVCQDEGCAYPIYAIGSDQLGCCTPVYLPFEFEDESIKISKNDLEYSAQYF